MMYITQNIIIIAIPLIEMSYHMNSL